MTQADGRRRGDPQSDRGITWALVIGLVALVTVGGILYGQLGSSPHTTGTAAATVHR